MNNINFEQANYMVVNNFDYDFSAVVAGVSKVRQAVCYCLKNGEVIVGVLTEPLFSLTERLTLLQNIEQEVSKITGKKAYVSLDTDIFVAISKCKEDAKAEEIKDIIFMRNNARM